MGILVVLPKVRLSFPNLWEARAVMGGKPKFSAAALLDLDKHSATIAEIKSAFDQLVEDDFKGKPPGRKLPMKLGREKYPDQEMYKNLAIVNASAINRPYVVDKNPAIAIMDTEKVYPGCYVNMAVDVYSYRNQAGDGITFGLQGVQFVDDGDRLDNRPAAVDVFNTIEEDDMPEPSSSAESDLESMFG